MTKEWKILSFKTSLVYRKIMDQEVWKLIDITMYMWLIGQCQRDLQYYTYFNAKTRMRERKGTIHQLLLVTVLLQESLIPIWFGKIHFCFVGNCICTKVNLINLYCSVLQLPVWEWVALVNIATIRYMYLQIYFTVFPTYKKLICSVHLLSIHLPVYIKNMMLRTFSSYKSSKLNILIDKWSHICDRD